MTDSVHRRFPKVLADQVKLALQAVEELGHEACFELLARHRRNTLKGQAACAAKFGIGPVDRAAPLHVDYEPIPLEWIGPISQLDEAFRALHSYNGGGAADYLADDVRRLVQKANAKRPRVREGLISQEDLLEELEVRGFFKTQDAGRRVEIKRAIAEELGLHYTSIDRRVRKLSKSV